LLSVLEIGLIALPDDRYPFARHDQVRADGDSCEKSIEIRKLQAVIRYLIGYQKLVQLFYPIGGELRCVYHEGVPTWLVRSFPTVL
jgi:hypothetical protein